MKVVDRKVTIGSVPQFVSKGLEDSKIHLLSSEEQINIYQVTISGSDRHKNTEVAWRITAGNVKGVWTSNALLNKRIRADWEAVQVSSSISIDAPVISAFSHRDVNIANIACSDPINKIDFELSYREEEDSLYCRLNFDRAIFSKGSYQVLIREDLRPIDFSSSLQELGLWFEKQIGGEIARVPESAKLPLYSTWYSYHQNFTSDQLLKECRISKSLGYEVLVVDDGWQTFDDNRGYDYTGDWRPERIPNMKQFAVEVHALGMKLMLWLSVPFCGKKSKAYGQFKGKFLTENHPWAPVFDVRFPEVRDYLKDRYVEAIKDWGVDGLKLDFIDDFCIYPETELEELNGRDTLSVNLGVEKLILEVKEALVSINPDVLIEFRQKYIGPSLRILGNMFRAFDCPFDSLVNRVRTTDVKLLCGESAVHSDMLTWPLHLKVEEAALQFTSILFSVPQLSIRLDEAPEQHLRMIDFYTRYWRKNREILLDGNFIASKPLSNYPILSAHDDQKQIIGLYEDFAIDLDEGKQEIDIVNGKMSDNIVLKFARKEDWELTSYNCMGDLIENFHLRNTQKVELIKASPNGLIKLTKV